MDENIVTVLYDWKRVKGIPRDCVAIRTYECADGSSLVSPDVENVYVRHVPM